MLEGTSPASTPDAAEALCDEDEILAAMSGEPDDPPAPAFGTQAMFRLPPIYFIGDSRTIIFRNAVYVSEFTSRAYLLRCTHLRSLHAADFFTPEAGINPSLMSTLATSLAVSSSDGVTGWTANRSQFGMDADGVARGPAEIGLEHRVAPLVLFCGAYDAHRVMDELGTGADIPAWDAMSRRYDVSTTPASRLVPVADVRRRVLEIMEPLALGIEALQSMGFDRIFVHGCPRTQLGERFEHYYGAAEWLRRYHPQTLFKVLILFDEAARSIAGRTAARYLGGPVNADGEIPYELTWDDVHYNARGAREVVRAVVAVLEGVVE
jgi:hypothetical protein